MSSRFPGCAHLRLQRPVEHQGRDAWLHARQDTAGYPAIAVTDIGDSLRVDAGLLQKQVPYAEMTPVPARIRGLTSMRLTRPPRGPVNPQPWRSASARGAAASSRPAIPTP
jgi:hypothetical protein